jgi:hypothetical protein
MDDRTIPALRQIIAGDVTDLVGAAVAPCWDQLRDGVLDNPGGRTGGRVRLLFEDYRRHLASRGPEERPSFARSSGARPGLVRALWQQTPAATAVLRDDSPEVVMRQLCAAEDLGLLQRSPDRARLVRFAPRAAQDAFDAVAAPGGVRWTRSSKVGAIRIVGLKPGAVELEWPTGEEPR